MLKIKDDVDLKELEKFGYIRCFDGSYWYKDVSIDRRIIIWKFDRSINDYVVDYITYDFATFIRYMKEGEYRHQVKKHIQDLIQAGLVEKGKRRR